MTIARRTLDHAISEAQWQVTVLDLARTLKWLFYHTYDSRRSDPGFPDVVLVKDRVIYAELKAEAGRVTPTQRFWIEALTAAGAEAYIWRPSDWPEVERTLRERVPVAHHNQLGEPCTPKNIGSKRGP